MPLMTSLYRCVVGPKINTGRSARWHLPTTRHPSAERPRAGHAKTWATSSSEAGCGGACTSQSVLALVRAMTAATVSQRRKARPEPPGDTMPPAVHGAERGRRLSAGLLWPAHGSSTAFGPVFVHLTITTACFRCGVFPVEHQVLGCLFTFPDSVACRTSLIGRNAQYRVGSRAARASR